jgi:hypothetical protein
MIRELVKIANKLDRLGLTSEADLLDSEIRKMAGVLGDMIGYAPGFRGYQPSSARMMSKWLDTMTLDGGFLGAFAKTLPTNSVEGINSAFYEVNSILNEIETAAKSNDGINNLVIWYSKNIESCSTTGNECHMNISNDLKQLADMIEDMSKHPRYNDGSGVYNRDTGKREKTLDQMYKPLVADIRRVAGIWERAYDKNDSELSPVTPSAAPAKTEAPVAEVAGNVKPPTAPATNPWSVYGGMGSNVKAAWLERTRATKKDPSFSNFQSWLRSRTVDSKDTTGIISRLNAETKAAGIKSEVSGRTPTFTEAKPSGEFKPGSGLKAVEEQRS